MLDTLFTRPGARVDRALNQLTDACIAVGLTPNALTYCAVALGIGAGVLFAADWMRTAFAVVVLSGIADAIDGRVARRTGASSPWGGVLDLTFDRVVEGAVLLGIALPRPEWHAPALVLAVTWYINLCVFLAIGAASDQVSEKVIPYAPGLLERSELLLLALVVVLLPSWAPVAAYVYAALEVLTAAQRFRHGHRALAPRR